MNNVINSNNVASSNDYQFMDHHYEYSKYTADNRDFDSNDEMLQTTRQQLLLMGYASIYTLSKMLPERNNKIISPW